MWHGFCLLFTNIYRERRESGTERSAKSTFGREELGPNQLKLGTELLAQGRCPLFLRCRGSIMTKSSRRKSLFRLTAPEGSLYDGGAEGGQAAAGMVTGRETEGSHLEPQAQNTESKLEMTQVFDFPKPTSSDILSPTRPKLLSLSKGATSWGPVLKYMKLPERISLKPP